MSDYPFLKQIVDLKKHSEFKGSLSLLIFFKFM